MDADRPITTADEDELGRVQLAEHITETVRSYHERDSLVVGILGPWGSGKTSPLNLIDASLPKTEEPGTSGVGPWESGKTYLFNLIEKEIYLLNLIKNSLHKTEEPRISEEEEKGPVVLHFDPWWYTGQRSLLQHFFNELSSQLREQSPHQWSDLASSMAQLGRLAAPVVALVAPYPFNKVVSAMGELPGNTPSQDEVRKKVEGALDKFKTPIWVLIDDLDRLQAKELLQIFVLLRSIADLPYTRYFLAMDPGSVMQQLQEGGHIQNGQEYLEKIIQVSYTLPAPADDTFEKQFVHGALDLFKETPPLPGPGLKQQIEDAWIILSGGSTSPILTTLRQVKLLLNAIELSYPPGLRKELWPEDVVLLEALRVFDPVTYQALEKDMVGTMNKLGNEPELTDWRNEDKYWNREILASYPAKPDVWTHEALGNLFPPPPNDNKSANDNKPAKGKWFFGASSNAAVQRRARDPIMIWRYMRKKPPEVSREQVQRCAEYLSAGSQAPMPEELSGCKDPDWAASLIGQVTSPLWEYSPDERPAILRGVLVWVGGLWDKLPQPPGRAGYRLLGSVVSGFLNLGLHDLLESQEWPLETLEELEDPLLKNYLLGRLEMALVTLSGSEEGPLKEELEEKAPNAHKRVDEEMKKVGTEALKFLSDFPDKVKSRPLDLILNTLEGSAVEDRLQYLRNLTGSKERIQNFLCKLVDWEPPALWKEFEWLGYEPNELSKLHKSARGTVLKDRAPGDRQGELKKELGDKGPKVVREAAMKSDYWEKIQECF